MKLEWSHGKRRPTGPRLEGHGEPVAALPSADAAPANDARTGRFLPGNRAYRRRVLKNKAKGIATLNPASCAEWLRPHVVAGAEYSMVLLDRVGGDPALVALAGAVADAHAVYRGLIALAAQGDTEALKEARAWLREHRSALATLTALAGERQGEAPYDLDAELGIVTVSTKPQPPVPTDPPPAAATPDDENNL